MTSASMGRRYIAEAQGRAKLVRMALEDGLWATVVREAQESVELFLKGALRLAAVEPARSHDVGDLLRSEAGRFPEWFRRAADRLASVSTDLAGDRGPAFYGDGQRQIAPQDLFDEADARRAVEQLDFVADLCGRLLEESSEP